MLKIFLHIILLLIFLVNECSLAIIMNVKEEYDSNKPLQDFRIETRGLYEIVAAGAAGGGDMNTDGGRGGLSAGIMELISGQVLNVYIGNQGDSIDKDKCGGAGGGGATTVFLKPADSYNPRKILLIGPGGGGAGYNQVPNAPDYNDVNIMPVIGDCPECDMINSSCLAAAPGRDIQLSTNILNPVNLTYNPSKIDNYTRGCFGGYGGGGQGGAWKDISNRTIHGGGGGGGGYQGGQVGMGKKAISCSAGGPGKAYCGMTFCNVTRVNEVVNGYFLIQLHQSYKELPTRDRTNYESPGGGARGGSGDGSQGNRVECSYIKEIVIITVALLLFV